MANNRNTRRRVALHAEKVEDSKELLRTFLHKNHYNNTSEINQVMLTLEQTSVPHISTANQRAQNSIFISQTLLGVLKSEKRRKEELLKLNCHDEVAALKQQQKDVRRRQLDVDATLAAWNMAGDDDMD